MMQPTAGGALFGLGNTLRSLTRSPLTSALSEAHRMARLRLESGGSARSPHAEVDEAPGAIDFELPPDIDPMAFAMAIEAKMRGRRLTPGFADPLQVLERRAGGRVVLHGRHILRLGDGRYDKGRAFLHGLVKDLRGSRWRSRFSTRR